MSPDHTLKASSNAACNRHGTHRLITKCAVLPTDASNQSSCHDALGSATNQEQPHPQTVHPAVSTQRPREISPPPWHAGWPHRSAQRSLPWWLEGHPHHSSRSANRGRPRSSARRARMYGSSMLTACPSYSAAIGVASHQINAPGSSAGRSTPSS